MSEKENLMNTKPSKLKWLVLPVSSFLLGVLVCAFLFPYVALRLSSDFQFPGQNLFVKRGPFKIYTGPSAPDGTETFVVFKDQHALYWQHYSEDGNLEIYHFENGLALSVSTFDKEKERVTRDYTAFKQDSLRQLYTYIDENNDGIWDLFIDHKKHKTSVWKDNQWVPRSTQGTNHEQTGG